MKRQVSITLCLAIIGVAAILIGVSSANAIYPTQLTQPTQSIRNPKSEIQNWMVPGDWPMYGHDVSRTNFNPDETIINAGNLSQLTQRWQNNVGSNGTPPSSAPSVANSKVFVGSSVASGNDFFAFDAVTGGQAWSASLNYQSSCFNVGLGSTAAISGTVVSVGGGDPAFYGLDVNSGQILWRNPMGLGSSAFPWESPLLAYDRSYLGMASRCDNPSVRGEVRAVDYTNGTPVASQTFVPAGQAGAGVWNSPALSPDGNTLVVATGEDYNGYNGPYNRAMVSLDPITLQIFQSFQEGALGQDLDYGTTPVIFHDNLNRVLVGANHKNGVFYTFVLNNISAGPLWQRSTGVQVGMMPAYDPTFGDGGTLFIGSSSGRLYAVDPATGLDRWPQVSVGGTLHGNMAIANRLIFVNLGSSGLKILDENNGATLRTLAPASAGSSYSGVAVSNGFIYWQAGSYTNAWSLPGTPGPTDTPTNTPIPTDTPTNAPTGTNTPTGMPMGTNTPTSPPITSTNAPTNTPTVVSSQSPVASSTRTPTPNPQSPTPTPTPLNFSDVHPSDYFYVPVQYLYCRNIISGYSDGTFRPFNNTTRGQLCKIIVLAEGWNVGCPQTGHFSDVLPTDPFFCYIETAYTHSVISGYSDGTFRPGNNVTRAQLCKIIVLSEGWTQQCTTQHFTDVPTTNPFYCFVETAYGQGVVSGYADGTFRPGNNATRGQICKIVYQAITAP